MRKCKEKQRIAVRTLCKLNACVRFPGTPCQNTAQRRWTNDDRYQHLGSICPCLLQSSVRISTVHPSSRQDQGAVIPASAIDRMSSEPGIPYASLPLSLSLSTGTGVQGGPAHPPARERAAAVLWRRGPPMECGHRRLGFTGKKWGRLTSVSQRKTTTSNH